MLIVKSEGECHLVKIVKLSGLKAGLYTLTHSHVYKNLRIADKAEFLKKAEELVPGYKTTPNDEVTGGLVPGYNMTTATLTPWKEPKPQPIDIKKLLAGLDDALDDHVAFQVFRPDQTVILTRDVPQMSGV